MISFFVTGHLPLVKVVYHHIGNRLDLKAVSMKLSLIEKAFSTKLKQSTDNRFYFLKSDVFYPSWESSVFFNSSSIGIDMIL